MNFKEALESVIEAESHRHTLILVEDYVPGLIEGDIEEIENEILHTTRWEAVHRAIFKHDDRFWEVVYNEGSTEYQESDSEHTEVHEVEPAEKTITYYKRIK